MALSLCVLMPCCLLLLSYDYQVSFAILEEHMGEMIELTAGSKQFPAYVAQPEGDIKGDLIVIHEVWGLVDHT